MATMHTLLRRQIKRWFGESLEVPIHCQPFLDAINEAYHEFDTDRAMLERSLELSSQELLQANSEMRAVFQAIPDLVFRIDRQGTILSFKSGAATDLLIDPRSLPGRRIQDIPVSGVGAGFRRAIEGVAQRREVITLEYSLAPQGQETPSVYEARFAPLLEDEIIVIVRNVTQRRHAEDRLKAAHQRLLDIIDFLPDATFVIDQDKRVIAWNRAIEEMTGVPKEAIIGCGDGAYATAFYGHPRPILVDLIDLDASEYSKEYAYVRRRGRALYAEVFVPGVFGGAGANLWVTASPLFDRDGNQVGAIESVRDITERKRLEEQFRQVQKMDAFGQLAAGVAHDFNNILTAIQGNLSILQFEDVGKAEAAIAVNQAVLAAERAANLTRQLLTFGRRQPIQLRAIDLNEVVANMTKMLQRLIGEHIALEAHYAPGGVPVDADPGMLEQVLANLAVNSRDAMPKGGRLVLETSPVLIADDDRLPEGAEPGPYVRLRVTDTGTGIAPEHLPHIFEPFYTTKEVGRGTGLGLATVFGIVEQHHGWIDVESEINKGTTILIYLPRPAASAAVTPETRHAPDVRRGTESILLVEDDPAVRRLMHSVLQRYGYRVHESRSAVEALQFWTDKRPAVDLLVTDMVMPGGMTGRELADRLLAQKPDLKVLYCSGYTDDILGADSPLRANANFLEKPFDPRKFLHRVRECLDGR